MKKKDSKFGIVFAIIFNLLIIIGLVILFITIKSDYSPRVIKTNVFTKYMNNKGCELTDLQKEKKYEGVNSFLVTNEESCPYLISYTVFSDKNVRNDFFKQVSSDVLNGNKNVYITNRFRINMLTEYYEYWTSGDEFKIVTLNNNSVLYASANNKYKNDIMRIFKDLGYTQKPNLTIIILISSLALTITAFYIICLWGIFKKTRNKGYTALIPIYNVGCLSKDVLGSPWYAILLFVVPYVNVIFSFVLLYKLGKRFNKTRLYSIFLILLPTIVLPLLAYDNSTYNRPIKIKKKKKPQEIKNVAIENAPSKKENKLSGIIKWIFTFILLLLSVLILLTYFEEGLIIYLINAVLFLIYSLLVCPLITNYTKKYKTYTKIKPLIIIILAIINLLMFGILPA